MCLDADAGGGDRRARLAAVRLFPHQESKITALYQRTECECGALPLSFEKPAAELVAAIRMGDARAIRALSLKLMDFSLDASLPFNTTSGRGFGASDPKQFLRDRRERFHDVLFRRIGKRLALEARIDPARLQPTTKAVDGAFDAAIEAYHAIDPLLDIEAEVAEEIVAKTGEVPEKREERFLEKLADRTYPILESRIEAGALLAANLIAGAWIEAGKPEVIAPTESVPTSSASGVSQTPTATSADPPFVGSKDSLVYHRATCAHVARIKPENRVYFPDNKTAEAAKRTPCKSCKPDAAAAPGPTNP